MMDRAYLRRLVRAELVLPSGHAKGITGWRERGLQLADLMVARFRREVAAVAGDPLVVEHPFLMPAGPYRRVFGDYANLYSGRVGEDEVVLRPDNMQASVARLLAGDRPGPLIAVGGLLRTLTGAATPLFRDRYIWPAVQLTALAPAGHAVQRLDELQGALEATIRALGLPVLSVRTGLIGDYGKRCYFTVSCLPDGRPTVLSTTYLMSERYRRALGCPDEVIDIGFTGKLCALVAMHHWDRDGLVLPTPVAPVQLGVLVPDDLPAGPMAAWRDCLAAADLRAELLPTPPERYRVHRAVRRWRRRGVPVVVGPGRNGGPARLLRRGGQEWQSMGAVPGLPKPAELAAVFTEHDRWMLGRAERLFDRGLRDAGLLRGVCDRCAAADQPAVFGWVQPEMPEPCAGCGTAGQRALLNDRGRFY